MRLHPGSDLEGGSLKAHISSGDRDAFVFNFAKVRRGMAAANAIWD